MIFGRRDYKKELLYELHQYSYMLLSYGNSFLQERKTGLFHELFLDISNLYILSLRIIFKPFTKIHLIICKKDAKFPSPFLQVFFQRYSLYKINTGWLCLGIHTFLASWHHHKNSPSFLSLYLSAPSHLLPGAGCCMHIF